MIYGAIAGVALLSACNEKADNSSDMTPKTYTEEQKAANHQAHEDFNSNHFSYAVGFGSGNQLRARLGGDIQDIDVEAFIEGFRQGLVEGDPKFTDEQIKKEFELYQPIAAERMKAAQEKAQKEREVEATKGAAEAKAFLDKNKTAEGVVTLESGLQYKVITEGKGEKPTAEDTVSAHYEGKLLNGEVFDSSYKRGEPTTFPVSGVIKGWQEALQLMPEGSKWELYIPPELGYGEAGRPGIPPNSLMIFTVELLDINPEQE